MARRIQGVFVILRALAPVLLLAVFIASSVTAVRGIRGAARTYADRVEAQVDTARQAFANASAGLAALAGYATAVKQVVDGVARDVRRVAASIQIPVINVSIQVPGVAEVKRVVAGVEAAGRVVGGQVEKVTALATVPAQLGEIQSATLTFAADVRSALVRWIVLVAGVVVLAVVVWILGSAAHIVGEVGRGWALLSGA
ncbi:MAG TPA: hypothetical protein VGA20_10250 [Gemmatimonadales bacterium]